MNNIESVAKSFLREVKGNIEFSNVEDYLLEKGFKVIFYNTEIGDMEISRYLLNNKAEKTKAFTYSGTANIVFIDNNTSPEDKTYLLYHELGHILLNHLKVGRMNTQNKILMDIEANAFVYHLLLPRKKKTLTIFISILTFLCGIGAATGYTIDNKYQNEASVKDLISTSVELSTIYPIPTQAPSTICYVYISSTGKYHRESCIHVQNKNYLKVDINEAKGLYQPCKVCNP